MTIDTFEREMFHRLGRGYRIRLSPRRSAKTYLIEQHIGQGFFDTLANYSDDEYERIRDGYTLVMACTQEPVMQCETCYLPVTLPHLVTAEVRCRYCYSKGEKSMYFNGYWPLGEHLLTHLESTHPRRHKEWRKEMALNNERKVKDIDRKCALNLESILEERHSSIVGIPRTYLSDHRTY